jgi:hypothetical protein
VTVFRKEAAEVDGDEAAAGSILVWNGLVARMRRVSAEADNPVRLDVESATRPHDCGEPRKSGEESETHACP